MQRLKAVRHEVLGLMYLQLRTGDRAANLAQAIACFNEALRFHTAEGAPAKYANIQYNLGTAYFGLPAGDRAANLERAIGCFNEALRFHTAKSAPLDYAMTQNNLGAAYVELPTGDRAANLERAIGCFTEALRFHTAKSAPLDYAKTQNNLGAAYVELPTGDRVANLERAIGCFTEALRFCTAEAAPATYAQTQSNLGAAYAELPTGDRAANLERAIGCFTEALRFRTGEAAPVDYAQTQINLGAAYSDLPTGDQAANLERAIGCYAEALRFCTAEAAPAEYALTQIHLGAVYLELPTGDRAANLERAIGCFTEALRFCTAEAAPAKYAATQSNLGGAYAQLPIGDRVANLARAIGCYTEALRFRTAEADPRGYAATQTDLGAAYAQLPTGDRVANLERAIGCYTEALRFRTVEADPAKYANTQHGLGTAYGQLPTGDRAANLERAIGCYTEALRFCTAEATPVEYVNIQCTLGNAYAQLPTGDRVANLERAIGCYTEALRFCTAEADPAGYAMTQANLGTAYSMLPAGDLVANLERAIGYFTEALRFCTAEAAPREYAQAQGNLGTVYVDLPTGDRAANLERAIGCFTEVLRFRTAEADPLGYAATQSNLGIVYAQLPTGDRVANLERAIGCFTEALRFNKAEVAPAECRRAARSLGDVHFEQGYWVEAHTAYALAIHAGELLYQATGSETGRQAELEAAGDVVAADAYCLARLGRLAEAVQRLEAGRARALGEALARDRAVLQELSGGDLTAFVAARDRINALEAEGRRGQDAEAPAALRGRSFAEWSVELVRAREDLDGVIGHVRVYLPGFGGEGLTYPEIAAIASAARPLVYLLTTSRGSLALLVPSGSQAPAPDHAIWLDGFTDGRLDELLVQRDTSGEVRAGYLVGQVTGELDQLAPAVVEVMEVLRGALLSPLARRLADLGMAAATIIPLGLLSLLPLPAAAPEGYTVALAPSARALRAACQGLQERAGQAPVLLAVGNPLPVPAGWDALGCAALEVSAIERFFTAGSRRTLSGDAATRAAVAHSLRGVTHLHLACHGGFDSDEPLDSALYLAGEDRLTLRDLLDGNLDLSSQRLAVLSACQTGITEFERVPDEVIGLPAGFLQAGIPGVVATLWPVNDQSTAVLVAEFYRLLLAGQQDPATALAGAREHLRDATAQKLTEWFDRRYNASGATDQAAYEAAADLRSHLDPAARPYAHPVYWAGFYYAGP
jgi:CHAT domain-containing protein/tetratricopeptide (TPR) repeat protein